MDANTVIVKAADGRAQALPLALLLERNAVLASRVNGQDISLSFGGANQLFIPGLPAKFFVRDVVSVEFAHWDAPPTLGEFEPTATQYLNRPNIALHAPYAVELGRSITFEGYADDIDRRIVAIRFSMDRERTWTEHRLEGAVPYRMAYWSFEYLPKQAGVHQVRARAVNEDGRVSPIAAVHTFEVR